MLCPVCRIPLVVVEREAIELDWCIECRGLWFDEGEMQLLGEKTGRRLEVEDLGRRPGDSIEPGERRCPRCRRRMQRLLLDVGDGARVELDRCPDHGIWLDRGELGLLMQRRATPVDADEELVLSFLGETFVAAAEPPAASPERREE